ncbi:hypothetical protein KCU65_g244, partial [Aureobasidium melanogenum]
MTYIQCKLLIAIHLQTCHPRPPCATSSLAKILNHIITNNTLIATSSTPIKPSNPKRYVSATKTLVTVSLNPDSRIAGSPSLHRSSQYQSRDLHQAAVQTGVSGFMLSRMKALEV